jgi:hypothetical protein
MNITLLKVVPRLINMFAQKQKKRGEGVLANTRISYVYSFHFQIPVLATTCTVKHHLLYLYINHLLLKATMVFVSLCFYAC